MSVSGLFLFAYEVYLWLRSGRWLSLSLIEALQSINWDNPAFISWLHYPQDWIGLHKVLAFVPLSVFLMVAGLLLFVLVLLYRIEIVGDASRIEAAAFTRAWARRAKSDLATNSKGTDASTPQDNGQAPNA